MRFISCVELFCLGICCQQLLMGVECSVYASDLSALTNLLKYIDAFIHQILSVLEIRESGILQPIDCYQILKSGNTRSGIYRIFPLNWKAVGSFQVYCDMETDGGGWTVIQRRGAYNKPKDDFFKTWDEYQRGFGKINEDFWLGNERIFSLTNQGNYSLRIDMQDVEGEKRYAVFQEFWIEGERWNYLLHISGYKGNAGDSLSDLNGMKFTTKDKDNDELEENNCSNLYKGGWWYYKCHKSNLNGLYLNGRHASFADGIEWYTWKTFNYSLPIVDMKIKPL